jgi:hypothetical protein
MERNGLSMLLLFSFALLVPPAGIAGTGNGVFALDPNGTPIDPRVYANPSVDGVALRVRWADLEPTPGVFNFSALDAQVKAATAAGKSASISFVAGYGAPSWLYAAGAAPFRTVIAEKYDASFCQPLQVPIPWDPVFLREWTAFVKAMGGHYGSSATVARVHITGINNHNEETSLPAATGATISGWAGQTCRTNDDVQEWVSLGYTATLLKNTWGQIADVFAASFPKAKIAPMVQPSGFPPIDDLGHLDPRASDLAGALISIGVARYGQQFAAQNNGLSWFFASPAVSRVAGSVTTGYQMLYDVTADYACRMNRGGTPCDPRSDLGRAVAKGIQSGGTYLEIYQVDILNPTLADIIASAHSQLPR